MLTKSYASQPRPPYHTDIKIERLGPLITPTCAIVVGRVMISLVFLVHVLSGQCFRAGNRKPGTLQMFIHEPPLVHREGRLSAIHEPPLVHREGHLWVLAIQATVDLNVNIFREWLVTSPHNHRPNKHC